MNVLCISSQVIHGPVGNSAAVPAIEAAGLTALSVPTTILSNHPGHATPVGLDCPATTLRDMLAAVQNLGWLNHYGSVMTGYFRDESQVLVVADTIRQMRNENPDIVYLCDPVLGDDPGGLYVPRAVAEAVRDQLVPLATIVAPNRFELEWLTGKPVTSIETAVAAARALARPLGGPVVLASSLPTAQTTISTAVVTPDRAAFVSTPLRPAAPHGTGDLLSGLFLAAVLIGHDNFSALARAMAMLQHVLDASGDTGILAVPSALSNTADIAALPLKMLQ